MDVRATQLAEILVDHSIKVQPGDKVIIDVSDFSAQDLTHECYRLCLERGAIVHLDVFGTNFEIGRADYGDLYRTFLTTANEQQLTTKPEIMEFKIDWADKFIRISDIHNVNFLGETDPRLAAKWQRTFDPVFRKMINKGWVLTSFPTQGTAQNAGMSLQQFIDFYYQASIVDYEKRSKWIKKLQDILDAGKMVTITGDGIDLALDINGRLAAGADDGTHNVPDGECFLGPVEDQTEGYIEFEYPQVRGGREVSGVRLEFKGGEVVKYSADKGGDYLRVLFDDHPGNRRLGELGIGMNKQITKYIKNILFDEKIAGTVHFALGHSYDDERGGGKNDGTIHWDMIKDLRHKGSALKVDDRVVIRDGELLV